MMLVIIIAFIGFFNTFSSLGNRTPLKSISSGKALVNVDAINTNMILLGERSLYILVIDPVITV